MSMTHQSSIHVGFKSFISAGLVSGLLSFGSAQAQDFDAVEIKSTDLGGGIYMLTGAGGNLGASFGEDGIFLIDDQYAPLTDKILAALKKIEPGEVKYVINTHCTLIIRAVTRTSGKPAVLSLLITMCASA